MQFSRNDLRIIFKNAHKLVKQGIKTISEALKITWAKFKAAHAKTVTFIKKDGTKTTRNIAPLSSTGFSGYAKGTSILKKSTIKVVDLDKVKAGIEPYRAIISFHYYQIVNFTY